MVSATMDSLVAPLSMEMYLERFWTSLDWVAVRDVNAQYAFRKYVFDRDLECFHTKTI